MRDPMIPSPTKPMRATGANPTNYRSRTSVAYDSCSASAEVRRLHAAVEPEPVRHRGGLGAAAHVELGEDPRHVDACRLLGHEEGLADLAVRSSLGDEHEHL